jgi:hypothetical protein
VVLCIPDRYGCVGNAHVGDGEEASPVTDVEHASVREVPQPRVEAADAEVGEEDRGLGLCGERSEPVITP